MLQALRISPAHLDAVLSNGRHAEICPDVRPVAITGPLLLVEDQIGIPRQVEVAVGKVTHKARGRLTPDDASALGEDFNGMARRMADQPSADMITLVQFQQPHLLEQQAHGYGIVKPLPPDEAFAAVSRGFFDSLSFKASIMGRSEALAAMVSDAVDLTAFAAQLAFRDREGAAPVVAPSMEKLVGHYGRSAFDAIAAHAGRLLRSKGLLHQP